ncbi:glycosyltransferase family protein [Tepidibacter mesophilus]|uniref:glycosyltransferase family protein n=1 Tax=Tepidibacter mesophilus TaxID=655607 RepID=UPI000C088D27|nr:glycosyltransferase [Tepidibacter mesophilus]
MKQIFKDFILKYVGYGESYIFAQNIYEKLKNISVYFKKYKKKCINSLDIFIRILVLYKENSTSECNESEIKTLARRIAVPITNKNTPLVSIIIPNKDGLKYLKVLISSLKMNTIYRNYEVIIVNNKSSNKLQKYFKKVNFNNLKCVYSYENLDFFDSINLGVQNSKGEYLVFLDNRTIPLYGWLSEMVRTFENQSNCGIVGSKLMYNCIGKRCIQYEGIKFNTYKEDINSYNLENYTSYSHDNYDEYEKEVPAINSYCMFTNREIFKQVNGFDTRLYFEKEDINYCLKVQAINKKVFISKKSLVLCKGFLTEIKTNNNELKMKNNDKYIYAKDLGKQLRQDIWEEKLNGKEFFWTESTLNIGFLVTEYSPYTTAGDLFSANGLGEELEKIFGYKTFYFPRMPIYEWDKIPQSIDVIISMRHDFDIRISDISSRTLKLAWIRGSIKDWLNKPWIYNYDGIITSSNIALKEARKVVGDDKCWGVVPLAVPPDTLKEKIDIERDIDISFVGNIFEVPRDIVRNLNLDKGFNFHFYGRLEGGMNHPWELYHKGVVKHKDLYKIYSRSKIVIEDTASFNKGTVNLRVFEAAACGALVIANETPGIEELFGENIIIYKNKEDLTQKIQYYLENEEERVKQAEKVREIVVNNHTFNHRAKEFKDIIDSVVLNEKKTI